MKSFSGSSDGKESACNVGDLGLILGWEDPLEKGILCQAEAGVWALLTELFLSLSSTEPTSHSPRTQGPSGAHRNVFISFKTRRKLSIIIMNTY